MNKNKSLGLSIFWVVLTIILIALVIFTVGINYIFASSVRSGSIFGKNIFIMNSNIMEPELEKGSAVISDSEEISVLIEGNVILFNEDTGFENVMRIVEVVHDTDQTVYRVSGDNKPDKTMYVPKENVIAKCVKVSPHLGSIITFFKSMPGIISGMIAPCVILLVMLLVKILTVKRRNKLENEEIVYPETSFGIGSSKNEDHDYSANPLFDPSMVPKPDASFALKKSSIAENFAMKPAAKKAPNGPSERNLKTESAVEKFRAAVDEKPDTPVSRKPSLAPNVPVSDKTEKMAAIKAALNNAEDDIKEDTEFEEFDANKIETLKTQDNENNITENSKPEPAFATSELPQPELKRTEKVTPKPAARKQDNIKSIDDLIKALEEEKKKL